MRNRRTRKRVKIVLILLLAICIMLFVESRIEAFVPQVKNFAEARIGQSLDGVKFSIGSLDGGIFHPLTLNDVSLMYEKSAPLAPSMVISNIKTSFRIWDVLKSPDALSFLQPGTKMHTEFSLADQSLRGSMNMEGVPGDMKVKGYAFLFGDNRIDFSGKITRDKFNLEIKPATGALEVDGTIQKNGEVIANVRVNHFKFQNYDIVCDATLINSGLANINGGIETTNLILNYRPFSDLKASYRVAGGKIEIIDLRLGETISMSGKIFLKKPCRVDMTLLINNASMHWLLSSLGVQQDTFPISGTMSARLNFKGPVSNPVMTAHLEIKKGKISDLDFDYLSANLKGRLPIIRLEDSNVIRESGRFVLAGEIDVSKFGKASSEAFSKLKIASGDNAVDWDELNATKTQFAEELLMKKKIKDDMSLGFKKFIVDQKIDEGISQRDEVEVEYKLHPNENLKMVVGQDKNFVGLEHKDKF